MEKNRDIKKYIDTVKNNKDFFKKYYYHSLIDLNLIKLDTILKYGILSKRLIEKNNLASIYTHSSDDFDSKNGNTFISLSKYDDNCTFNGLFESFPLHTLTSLSLLVNKAIKVSKDGEKQTFFDDEIFCLDLIEKNKLEGIILPEHLSNLNISEVNPLPSDLSCYTRSYLNHWIKCVENYFRQTIPDNFIKELKISYENFWDIADEYECPEKWVEGIISTQRERNGKDIKDILAGILDYLWKVKYQTNSFKYIEIIDRLNSDNLPIYEIKEKSLKKIN